MKRATTWLLSITIALCAAGGTPMGVSVHSGSSSNISRTIETRAIHKSRLSDGAPKYARRSRVTRVWHDQQFENSQLSTLSYQRPPPAILL